MTSRERVKRTLDFQYPDRAPRDLWALAGVGMLRKAELEEVQQRFPSDFCGPRVRYGTSKRARGTPAEVGEYVDEWGCVWNVAEIGVCGEVKQPPLEDWSALAHFTPPWEILNEADFSQTNESCAKTDKFVKAGTGVRPFERMQFLRGSENLFLDLAYLPKELLLLRDMVHEYFVRELELWVKTDVEAIGFMDDWGAQSSLLISPDLWRQIYKPLYADYCSMIKKAGKYVFFHSDGHIRAIIPDLIEIGVDAMNSQLFCMDIEEIGRSFKGKITFWGEICRQRLLPFGTVDEVRAAVRRVRRALDEGKGGVIAQCEWGIRDPKENIEAVFETWSEDHPASVTARLSTTTS
ncbi:MAG: methyltransferase [Candidatus Hydrogenedentes bacterium]|nr:methyltransferase [Candidatus Hydrogenedentota bacterium]